MEVYRGERLVVPLLAFAQGGATETKVTAVTSRAKLDISQTTQNLPDYCYGLSYTLYSTADREDLVLYPDGPCRDTGRAKVTVHVTFLPCPPAFTLSGEHCVCEQRLQAHEANCMIGAEDNYITKQTGSHLWVGASHYSNGSYEGLILAGACPVDYCKAEPLDFTLADLDRQCDNNRSGLLCGACAANLSLMLGRARCAVCPNMHLTLLLPFAAAGAALVVFLSVFRLTVATGSLNSIRLYANIGHVNRKVFFPNDTPNVLTVFLAWMNLDLGIEACFYDRMDEYAQTWLQFVFPIYVWILISVIILTSRYSITVSKLIGHNPIAVLATLILLSYTKILKIIIQVFSYAELEYPSNTTTVWLKDANVPYLQSQHLLLTVVTSLVLTLLFLPYTLLLLLGSKLYCFTGRKSFCWLNRLKPLLDSYYAPCKAHTRYWPGFLLLVRCVLYIVLTIRPTASLVAITITFTAIGFGSGYIYSGRIYTHRYVNIIESSVYLNLIILSVATSNSLDPRALVYVLVGMVLTLTMAITAQNRSMEMATSKCPALCRHTSTAPQAQRSSSYHRAQRKAQSCHKNCHRPAGTITIKQLVHSYKTHFN